MVHVPNFPGQGGFWCKVHSWSAFGEDIVPDLLINPQGVQALAIRRAAIVTGVGFMSGHFTAAEMYESISQRLLPIKIW
jgi:hypothetical protein